MPMMLNVPNSKIQRSLLIFLTIVFLISIGLRLYAPLADLPPDISFSGSIYTDEGNQCHNSRSKVLYGNWYEDDWQITRYNPILPYFKYVIFKLLGVGFLQVRAVSIIFSILTFFVLFLLFKNYFSPGLVLIGTLFAAINYFIVMFGKIGTFETPMIFWMVLSLYFIEKYRKTDKLLFLFLSGASAFVSFIFKNISAYFVPIPLFALLLYFLFIKGFRFFKEKRDRNSLIVTIAGIFSVFIVWYLLFYLPNKEWIMSSPGKYIGNQVIPKTLQQGINNFFAFNWKEQFFKIPILWVVSLFYLPIFFRKLFRKKVDITEISFALFFIFHSGFFMVMNHRPTRYLLPVIFSMLFLTVKFFQHLIEKIDAQPMERFSPSIRYVLIALDFIWLLVTVNFCLIPLLHRISGTHVIEPFSLLLTICLLFAVLFFNLISGSWDLSIIKRFFRRKTVYGIILLLIISSVGFNLHQLKRWDDHKTYTVKEINEDLKHNLKNAFIAGLTAPVSVLESTHRSLFLYPEFVNWDNSGTASDTYIKYPISHALLATFNDEISLHFNAWPDKFKHAKLIKSYSVKDQFLHLYSFKAPYIQKIEREDVFTFKLNIVNAGKSAEHYTINQIYKIKRDMDSKPLYEKRSFRYSKKIDAGSIRGPKKTQISVKADPELLGRSESVLFNIELDDQKPLLRYEGEKFPGRTGRVVRAYKQSGQFVKIHDPKIDASNFIAHGHYGEVNEFSEGFITAKFHLAFENVKNMVKKLCYLDLYNKSKKKVLNHRYVIGRRDGVKKRQYKGFEISGEILGTQKIEFRLKSIKNNTHKIYFDFLELDYYQGRWFFLKGEENGETDR